MPRGCKKPLRRVRSYGDIQCLRSHHSAEMAEYICTIVSLLIYSDEMRTVFNKRSFVYSAHDA